MAQDKNALLRFYDTNWLELYLILRNGSKDQLH